jgi:hypothetical protein
MADLLSGKRIAESTDPKISPGFPQSADLNYGFDKRRAIELQEILMGTPPPTFGRRMRTTYFTWLLLGALVGAIGVLATHSAIMVISGMIAGMILLPVPGLAIGVLGGDIKGTLVGAAGGLLGCWFSSCFTGHAIQAPTLQLSVLFGALVGATFSLYLMMKIWTYTIIYGMARSLLLLIPAEPIGRLSGNLLEVLRWPLNRHDATTFRTNADWKR